MIAALPASFVWKYLSPELPLRSIQLNVSGVGGTVWDGHAVVSSRGIQGVLNWDISVLGLMTGKLPIALAVDSNAGELTTNVRLHSNGVEIEDTQGLINLETLNPILKRQRVTLNGQFKIDKLSASFFDGTIEDAEGLFNWTGGRVEYPAGRDIHGNEFPPFTGRLSQQADITSLIIKDKGAAVDAIEANMLKTGVATLKIKRRLLDLANEPWPKNSSESDVVFKIKRKIL